MCKEVKRLSKDVSKLFLFCAVVVVFVELTA